jgi:hypothetical protein
MVRQGKNMETTLTDVEGFQISPATQLFSLSTGTATAGMLDAY